MILNTNNQINYKEIKPNQLKQIKKKLLLSLVILAIICSIHWKNENNKITVEQTRSWLIKEIEHIEHQLNLSLASSNNLEQLKALYHISRKHYKHIEFFIEYCSPRECKYYINGPLVPKHDEEFGMRLPQGFQRIEELAYNSSQKLDTSVLHFEYNLLINQLINIKNYYQSIEISEEQLLEMCQIELFRIVAMDLNGYDATISKTNVEESIWCLEGIEFVIQTFSKNKLQHKNLLNSLQTSKAYLASHQNYDTFNRLYFITQYINVLNKLLVEYHYACKLPWVNNKQALNLKQAFLFEKKSFNLNYFSMYYNDTINLVLQAELGRLLFFDPILSGNNQRSCASCHNPSKGFTDGLPKSLAMDGKQFISINAPTLLNVVYQKAFFYDGRAYQLEQQIFDVVHNRNEMQSSLDDVISKLKRSKEYKNLFNNAFRGTLDSSITNYAIQKALTEYEKTLTSLNSRFDKYIKGDLTKLTTREINGYNIFSGKALCGSCHFFPLFNGTVPPFFNDSEFEVIGTSSDSSNNSVSIDSGRYAITNFKEHLYSFKTPSIRNIQLTAPYMHNGVYNRLEQVVEFYHKGGGAGLGYIVPNQTLPFDSLQLNKKEKEDLILFMKSLLDTTGKTHKPKRLPFFENDKELNQRKIGGLY